LEDILIVQESSEDINDIISPMDDPMMPADEMIEIVRKYALQNAVLYGGKASSKAVMGKVMAEMPELRSKARELMPLVDAMVSEINSLPPAEQRSTLERLDPSLLSRSRSERVSLLPELPGAKEGQVVMRFAPGPSGPLHIGHTRVAVLNDEYVKRYKGTFINRIEDTNPEKIDPAAYEMIPEDLEWLEVEVHRTVIQSSRFELYYSVARQLLEMGKAYVCRCDAEEWRSLKEQSIACPHRSRPIEEHLENFDRMLDGGFSEGEAVVVIKTDLNHPNPAIRDFVGLRIVDSIPHPKTGDRYAVYPMMNLSVAVDDHLLGLTHVLRGKDHLNNTLRQEYIFKHLGWEMPWYYHYGLVSVLDTILKTSLIREGIAKGEYTGWDDVRLGTIRAMRRRGISPKAIRRYWIDCGMKDVDIQFSWDTLWALNRDIIDPAANRYAFVWEPVELPIEGVDSLDSKAPLHPDEPGRGYRRHSLEAPIRVFVTSEDMERLRKVRRIRLKDLCNVEFADGKARYIGNDLSLLKEGVGIIHWVPSDGIPARVLMTDGSLKEGLAERLPLEEEGRVVQFERFGFARVERVSPDLVAVFAHT